MTLRELAENPTIGDRIDNILAAQDLLRFPSGSAVYAAASMDLLVSIPALKISMIAEGLTEARTRIAYADIDMASADHNLVIERIEMAI